MKRKYSYREIEREVRRNPDEYHPLSADDVLDLLKDAMNQAKVSEDARVWEWPAMDRRLDEAYERAMSIL